MEVIEERLSEMDPGEDIISVEFRQTEKGYRIRAKSPKICEIFKTLSRGDAETTASPRKKAWVWQKNEQSWGVKEARVYWGDKLDLGVRNGVCNFTWLLYCDLETGTEALITTPMTQEQRNYYKETFQRLIEALFTTYIQKEEVKITIRAVKTGGGLG
jgi:hypothetical protein